MEKRLTMAQQRQATAAATSAMLVALQHIANLAQGWSYGVATEHGRQLETIKWNATQAIAAAKAAGIVP